MFVILLNSKLTSILSLRSTLIYPAHPFPIYPLAIFFNPLMPDIDPASVLFTLLPLAFVNLITISNTLPSGHLNSP